MTTPPPRRMRSPADRPPWGWLAPVLETAALASGNWPLSANPGPKQWTRYPRVATRAFAADAGSVRAARRFTIATLQRWGTGRGEDMALVVSELLTNALRHALPAPGDTSPWRPVRLGLLQPGPCVLCAVADPSQRPPVPAQPGCLAEVGRGLNVISALADTWGYTPPCDTGKVVWALLSAKLPLRPGRPVSPLPKPTVSEGH
jgi:hypothetical protein